LRVGFPAKHLGLDGECPAIMTATNPVTARLREPTQRGAVCHTRCEWGQIDRLGRIARVRAAVTREAGSTGPGARGICAPAPINFYLA